MCVHPDPTIPAFNSFREISMFFPLAYSPEDFAETIRPQVMVCETLALDQLPELAEAMPGPIIT